MSLGPPIRSGLLGHCHVGESSDGPDPFVGDGCDTGQWGPRGTHVS
jgi:hypothetical protein